MLLLSALNTINIMIALFGLLSNRVASLPILKNKYNSISKFKLLSTVQPRILTNGIISLDTNLIATNPDLVISHLNARKSYGPIIEEINKIKNLRADRSACIVEGDAAKNLRKVLSKEIGTLMKDNKIEEVNAIKLKVEEANKVSALCDEKLAAIDIEIDKIFSLVPNLLDDRYV